MKEILNELKFSQDKMDKSGNSRNSFIKLKSFIAVIMLVFVFTSCTLQQETSSKIDTLSAEDSQSLMQDKNQLDAFDVQKIFSIPTIKYRETLNGYDFNLPFNYRIRFVPVDNKPGNYFKFQWKINDNFIINSEAKDFKHFKVSNFIPYMPQGAGEGDFFLAKSTNATKLSIKDFLETEDEVLYSDENSAIFKTRGSIKAFFFEYLPKTGEYLIYLSDTPFFNKRPEVTKAEEIDQLLSQVRMAKNIFKPINNPSKTWDNYQNQLTILEKRFFEAIEAETKAKLKEEAGEAYYSPADQGNNEYYTVYKFDVDKNPVWGDMAKVEVNSIVVGAEKSYLKIENNSRSMVLKGNTKNGFMIMAKSKSHKFMLQKEFPPIYSEGLAYYKNEIDFYKALLENFD